MDQASLTGDQRTAFVDALVSMKNTVHHDDMSVYDHFVHLHYSTMAIDPNPAHGGPAFLPWHRQFIWEFESAVLQHDTTGLLTGLPYWNWTVDQDPQSGPWTVDFMGGDGDPNQNNEVTTGAFGDGTWTFEGDALTRSFSTDLNLPTTGDVQAALQISTYDSAPWDSSSDVTLSFRNFLEGFHDGPELHNLVHVWVGGFMNSMASPLDPIFWLHHSFVDRIWFEWQLEFGFDTYLPFEDGPEGHNLFDLLGGFDNVLLADTLDPRFFDETGFYYEGLPIPEPAWFAGLLGLAALGLALRRRTRLKDSN